jgi:hypothetical protein
MNYSPLFGTLASLACLSSPLFAQSVLRNEFGSIGSGTSSLLEVDDADITPDGRYIVARINTASTSARVYDAATGAELATYENHMGVVSGAARDAVEVTNDRAVVIGNISQIIDLTNLSLPPMACYPKIETWANWAALVRNCLASEGMEGRF